ncbi:DUF6397 family protein [Streptomyces meridianus]|uniref:DUF6397 family protein n=1 Tax=Streptomyces meridianus TaxID=2938945 RepID=A0ABT0XAL8_9ACTN|nr:DUF6397 family protein [Streptomyces meridianus]MCM2579562.1 DUF6397 family protein [Streptomyces meridianus]
MAVEMRVRSAVAGGDPSVSLMSAAGELGLKRGQLDLAVLLEEIRTVPSGRGRRVPVEEIERLRAAEGFPGSLTERLRVVGTAQGAALMGTGPARFARLARVGCFSPVRFSVNRYRAVVWVYRAVELKRFAECHPQLLTGRTPRAMRGMLEAGEDWRARNWRSRRMGQLVRQTDDPWERAAVSAAVLGGDELAQVVEDPGERAHLRRLRPALIDVGARVPASRRMIEQVIRADDPDELLWHRISLGLCLDDARESRPAPWLETPGAGRRRASRRPAATAGPAGRRR